MCCSAQVYLQRMICADNDKSNELSRYNFQTFDDIMLKQITCLTHVRHVRLASFLWDIG